MRSKLAFSMFQKVEIQSGLGKLYHLATEAHMFLKVCRAQLGFSFLTTTFQRAHCHWKHHLSGQLHLFFLSAYSTYGVVTTQRNLHDFSAWLISSKSTHTFSIFHAWEMCKTIKMFGHLRRLNQQTVSVLSNLQVKLNFNLNK